MFSSKGYRAKAAEYVELGKKTDAPEEAGEFKAMERSFTALADNEDWLAHNYKNMVHAEDGDGTYGNLLASKAKPCGDVLAAEEEHVLRCLGAAVIMQWNTIPKKLQRELFDNAGAVGDLLETKALRGKIARFLHKHKDDEPQETTA
jgi:hypothetical protein